MKKAFPSLVLPMGRFSAEGVFYLHLMIISLVLVIFTILKNFNFEDYLASPDLTINQLKFVYLFVFIAIIGMLLLLGRGYFVKTPQFYTRAGIAMVFIIIGLIMIISMLFHDDMLGQDRVIGPREMLGILFGSFIMIMGSYTYISIKFPDTTMMKYFKQAVKEEIRKRGAEEQRYRFWQQKQRQYTRSQRQKQKVVKSAKKTQKQKEKQKARAAGVPQAVMSPPGDITVVQCSKCNRSLKLTSKERPLTIKCPFCEAIGVIKE